MIAIILTALLVKSVCCLHQGIAPRHNKTFIYNSYPYDERIIITVNNTTEHIMEFYENSTELAGFPTRVHVSANDTVLNGYPVFISAVQQKAITSWSMPLVIETTSWALVFLDTSRTLCLRDAGPDVMSGNRPMVQISTSSPQNLSVDIKLRRVMDFYVEVDQPVELEVKPSTPKYFYFAFDQHPWNITDNGLLGSIRSYINYTIPKSVILIIESDNDLCATISIQNKSCPVMDNEKNVLYEGYYLTMTTKGGITLTRSMFPSGFYVAFVVKQTDDECMGTSGMGDMYTEPDTRNEDRLKKFRFTIVGTISKEEYLVGCLVILALVALVVVFVLVTLVPFRRRCGEREARGEEQVVIGEEQEVRGGEQVSGEEQEAGGEEAGSSNMGSNGNEEAVLIARAAPEEGPRSLTVGQLCQATPEKLAWRSHRYFWGALTVAIVYTLPVVQILVVYQQMVFQTGNQDLCYYNFLCAHPLGFLSDFNHVFSNVGYVLLGAVFLLQVWARQWTNSSRGVVNLGISQHYGLLFSMGLGLIMEGFLSASYHLCPNKMNFQFDTSFMYYIAVLSMLKLYQNRHSDLIPSAHSTFIVLAFIIAIGVFGILYPSVVFTFFFTVLYLFACFILTLKIYYAGTVQMDRALAGRAWDAVQEHGWVALVPEQRARGTLLALANVANWALVVYFLIGVMDFATKLLIILISNTFLYTLFYIIMKMVYREKILLQSALYGILALAAWIYAATQFTDTKTLWSKTPAQSRHYNSVCTFVSFYDSHDVWHLASAVAIYLSFNMLLTLDDELRNTPRDPLPVF